MLNINDYKLELGGEYKAYLGYSDKLEEVKDELFEVSDIIYLEGNNIKVVITNKNRKNVSITLNNPELTENSIKSSYCVFIVNN